MIRVNLARHLVVNGTSRAAELKERGAAILARWKLVAGIAAVLAVLAGVGAVVQSTLNSAAKTRSLEQLAEEQREKAIERTAQARAKAAREALPKGPTLASERASVLAALELVSSVPMRGVAVSDVALRAGGLFYVSGIADDQESLKRYSGGLRAKSSEFREGPEAGVGASKRARTFSRYGRVKHAPQIAPFCDELVADVSGLEAQFGSLAERAGVKMERFASAGSRPLEGDCSEESFGFGLRGDYAQIASFLRSLESRKNPVGVSEVRFRPEAKGGVSAKVLLKVRHK